MQTKREISAAETEIKTADLKIKDNTNQLKKKQMEMKKTEAEYKRDSGSLGTVYRPVLWIRIRINLALANPDSEARNCVHEEKKLNEIFCSFRAF